MGRLIQHVRMQGSGGTSGKSAADKQLAAEEEAYKYGEAPATSGMSIKTKEQVQEQGATIIANLKAAGVTSGPDWEAAAKMKVQGYDPRETERGFLSKAVDELSWLDKLGATVRFAVADWTGIDTAAGEGGRYGSEITGEDFKDIWAGRFESIVARHGAEAVGEEGRMSGGQMLDNIGWDTSDKDKVNWANRLMHGIVGFGGEMALDPLTYLTGGLAGMGRKAALTSADRLVTSEVMGVVAKLVRGVGVDSLDDGIQKTLGRTLKSTVDDAVTEMANGGLLASGLVDYNVVAAKVLDSPGVQNVIVDEFGKVGKAIANRDFLAMPEEWLQHALKHSDKSYRQLTGGLRVTANPFGGRGFYVPGTRGAGRKLTRSIFGTPLGSTAPKGFMGRVPGPTGRSGLRGLLDTPGIRATTRFRDLVDGIGIDNSILRAMQQGDVTSARTFITERAAKQAAQRSGIKQATGLLGIQADDLSRAARNAGMSEEEANDLFAEVISAVQHNTGDTITHAVPEVEAAARVFAKGWGGTMEVMFKAAKEAGLELREMKNYVPLVRHDETARIFDDLARLKPRIPVDEALDEDDPVRVAAELLNEMLASYMRREGAGAKILGDSAYTTERLLGIRVKTRELGDATLFEVIDDADVAFIDFVTMNRLMTDAVMGIADEVGLAIPKGWTVLESNPFKVADKYLVSMTEAINEAQLISKAKTMGLIKDASWRVDKGRMAAALAEGYKDLTPIQRQSLEEALEEAVDRKAALAAFERVGKVPPPLKPLTMVEVSLAPGVKVQIPKILKDNKRIVKQISQSKRHLADKWGYKKGVRDAHKAQVNALKAQGMSDEMAQTVADAATYEPIEALNREIELALSEEVERQAKGLLELTARLAAESGETAKEAVALSRAELRKFTEWASQVRENGRAAVQRALGTHGITPVSVVPVNTDVGRKAVADEFARNVSTRLEALADQAENVVTEYAEAKERQASVKLATKLREIAAQMAALPEGNHKDQVPVLKGLLNEAKELMGSMNGIIDDNLTYFEWVDNLPKRKRSLAITEQEQILKELLDDPMIDTPPFAEEFIDDQAREFAKVQWFDAFEQLHGVDPRALYAPDRRKLAVLLRKADGKDMAGAQVAKDKILRTTDVEVPDRIRRSQMAMVLDVAERDRRRGWVRRIGDVDLARRMDPKEFWETFGPDIAEAATEGSDLYRVLAAHKLMSEAGVASKNIDKHLAGRIINEFELITAMYEGRNVWRDLRLRGVLEDLFEESPWAATHRLRAMGQSGFQMESLEEITTLTVNQVKQELKLAGWTDSFEEAATAIAEGRLTGLSDEAIATLGLMPTQDQKAVDTLMSLHQSSVEKAILGVGDKAKVTATEAIEAHKVMEQIGRKMKMRGADGQLAPSAMRAAKKLLDENDKLLRRTLPKSEWSHLDEMYQQIETALALRQPGLKQHVKTVINKNNALRNDLAYAAQEAKSAVNAQVDLMWAAMKDEEYEGVKGSVDLFRRYAQILQELLGMGGDMPNGATRAMWATEADLDYIKLLAREGRNIGQQLGDDKLVKLLDNPAQLGTTASAEDAFFVPPSVFGLAGPQLEGQVVAADLGKFMEHTARKMLALNTPVGLQQFGHTSRQILHWWKGMATVANPNFHIRNFISAAWNNELIDVKIQDYAFVAKHWKPLKKAFKETGSWAAAADTLQDPTARFVFRSAAENGLFDATFANSELLGRAARRHGGSAFSRVAGNNNVLLEVGGATMESIEGFMRLAAFTRHMPKNLAAGDQAMIDLSGAWANDLVNMVHFDYNALTDIETRLKQYIPFFVWTRRNIPLQMRMMIERPQMLAAYSHMVHSARDEFGTDDEIGPRKWGGTTYIGTDMMMNEDTPFWARWLLDPDIPLKDLESLGNPLSPSSYLNMAVSMLGPHISTPMKAYFDDSYDTNAPVGWQTVTRMFNKFTSDVDGGVAFADTRPRVDSKVAEVMKLLFPPAATYGAAFEGDPKRMAQRGIVDGDLGSRVLAGLRQLALPGLGFKTHTAGDEYSVYSSSLRNDTLREGRRSGLITPETEMNVQALLEQIKAQDRLQELNQLNP